MSTMQKLANGERAKKAKRTLNCGYDAGESLPNQVEMILIDLFHLCERDGVIIANTLARAQRIYKSEGGIAEFRVLDGDQMQTAINALVEELTRLEESGEKDYQPDELQNKKRSIQTLLQKLE